MVIIVGGGGGGFLCLLLHNTAVCLLVHLWLLTTFAGVPWRPSENKIIIMRQEPKKQCPLMWRGIGARTRSNGGGKSVGDGRREGRRRNTQGVGQELGDIEIILQHCAIFTIEK